MSTLTNNTGQPNITTMIEEENKQTEDKDTLSQEDLKADIKTFEKRDEPHAALETPEGKNNGAKPAAINHQRTSHP